MRKSIVYINRTFFLSGIFSIAMGILEAVVVIYLRELYYPAGFSFPLEFLTPPMLVTEYVREICTLVMLGVLGILAGRNNLERFLYFLFCFGVWDITYYAGLKVFLGWPSSPMEWDILFLIPVPWTGPVLAPLICSMTMLAMSIIFIRLKDSYSRFKIKLNHWGYILLGTTLIFIAFILDYFTILVQNNYSLAESSRQFAVYVPEHFPWLLFGIGEASILYGIVSVIVRTRSKRSKST